MAGVQKQKLFVKSSCKNKSGAPGRLLITVIRLLNNFPQHQSEHIETRINYNPPIETVTVSDCTSAETD